MEDFNLLAVDLREKLKADPENVNILNDLAIASMEVNEFEEAFEYFKIAANIKPSVQSLNNLGYFYFKEGEPEDDGWRYREDKAIDLLEKTIELKPKSHIPYAILGEIYAINKDYIRAKELLGKSISIKPTLENLNNMGVCHYYTSSMDEAHKYFNLANLKRGNENLSLYPMLSTGMCLTRLGRVLEAKQIANELITNCKDTDLYFEEIDIAELFYEIEDYKKVADIYRENKYSFSKLWIPSYLYSLKQLGSNSEMNKVFTDVIKNAEKEIEETLIDDDEEWSYEDKQEYIDDLRSDISFYKKSFQKILNGQRPLLDFHPSIESTCYLFGCIRHNNPHYLD